MKETNYFDLISAKMWLDRKWDRFVLCLLHQLITTEYEEMSYFNKMIKVYEIHRIFSTRTTKSRAVKSM